MMWCVSNFVIVPFQWDAMGKATEKTLKRIPVGKL